MGRADRRASASVILKAADGAWTNVGSDSARGIFPEGVSASANESGPDTCSFTLKRKASVQWPDLIAFNQAEVWVGGVPVWGGRIWEAPLSDGGDDVIAVTGRGWQYHLDDDLISKYYVHTDLPSWRDTRSYATANLGFFTTGGVVGADNGAVTLGWSNGAVVKVSDAVGVTLDIGPGRTAKRIVVTYRCTNADANVKVFARATDVEDPASATFDDAFSPTITVSSGTLSGTFATARRFVHLFLQVSVTGTFGADVILQITKVQVFSATAYESGDASILKASQVVADAMSGAPLLDPSTANIETTSFSIPDLAPSGYQTPRSLMNAANAYEGNLVGVGVDRRVFFRERQTIPRIEVGEWSGSQFQDSSTNSGESLYNRVIVQGSGPDGSPINEVRTATSSLLNRQGFSRAAVLSVGAPMTTASAQALGDVWLAEKAKPPLKGTLTITGHGGARWISGGGLHASELLLMVGERIRIGNLVDPDNGSWSRDGTIKAVSYAHETETATVELDNERGRLESLLERLAVVTTQAVR